MKRRSTARLAAAVLCIFIAVQSSAMEQPAMGARTVYLPLALDAGSRALPVDIIISDSSCAKNMLVLPGWNFSRKRWQQETAIMQEAHRRKYNLILPEMGVTVYESQYFQETKRKWSQTPGSVWISKILIPALQKQGLLLPSQFNTVMGLSTGGRGAVMTVLYNKGIFKAAASLSGDFRQELMPNDRLMTAVYGPYTSFKERWETVDNPYYMAPQWDVPLYVGHGIQDGVVPYEQSVLFYKAIKKLHPGLPAVFHSCACRHDFAYWSSEVVPILAFFDRVYSSSGQQL